MDNVIEHACEASHTHNYQERKEVMMTNHVHANHPHRHGQGCGHTRIGHGDHIDYVHDGHLHHQNGAVVEEHAIEVSAKNLNRCAGIRAYGP